MRIPDLSSFPRFSKKGAVQNAAEDFARLAHSYTYEGLFIFKESKCENDFWESMLAIEEGWRLGLGPHLVNQGALASLIYRGETRDEDLYKNVEVTIPEALAIEWYVRGSQPELADKIVGVVTSPPNLGALERPTPQVFCGDPTLQHPGRDLPVLVAMRTARSYAVNRSLRKFGLQSCTVSLSDVFQKAYADDSVEDRWFRGETVFEPYGD